LNIVLSSTPLRHLRDSLVALVVAIFQWWRRVWVEDEPLRVSRRALPDGGRIFAWLKIAEGGSAFTCYWIELNFTKLNFSLVDSQLMQDRESFKECERE
jgi:hypothetical protein